MIVKVIWFFSICDLVGGKKLEKRGCEYIFIILGSLWAHYFIKWIQFLGLWPVCHNFLYKPILPVLSQMTDRFECVLMDLKLSWKIVCEFHSLIRRVTRIRHIRVKCSHNSHQNHESSYLTLSFIPSLNLLGPSFNPSSSLHHPSFDPASFFLCHPFYPSLSLI